MEKFDILKKSFYLTSLFSKVKSDHSWSTNEIKLVLLLFSKLSKYKIYLPDLHRYNSFKDEFYKRLKSIPKKYIFTRMDFKKLTNVNDKNLAREINKVRKKLISKAIHIPHPFEKNYNSGDSITWFTLIRYSHIKGEILIQLNESIIERLVAFASYSTIDFNEVINIKNAHALHIYLLLRILIDSSFKKSLQNIIINIKELKSNLSIQDKYTTITQFRKKVLDITLDEINKKTTLKINYELKKTGRKYTHIYFQFKKNIKLHN